MTRLLESERLHGISERDPTQKRHDFVYFTKNSYFVLVEDLRQELATIAAQEYPIERGPDGVERGGWPVLHCHPRARGPFIEYDEKEEKRRQKADRAEHEREKERAKRTAQFKEEMERRRKAMIALQAKQHDLRRTVSLNNLHRRASFPQQTGHGGFVDLDADFPDEEPVGSANASGYLASGTYMAASGNSVGITSTTGTTSTAGLPSRSLQMPHILKGRLQQQVVTSRRVAPLTQSREGSKENVMGPPLLVPDRQRVLRKSRSTNTIRLPKREEGAKPGYCESCRVKFEDFTEVRFSSHCSLVAGVADVCAICSTSRARGTASSRRMTGTSRRSTASWRACAAARRRRLSSSSARESACTAVHWKTRQCLMMTR